MQKIPFYILAVALLSGCIDKRSKKEFKSSKRICDSLYMELYTVFGSGALGGDLLSAYITDSTNFRKYLGTFDNAEGGYHCECKGDSIIVSEVIRKQIDVKIRPIETFNVNRLKEKGEFE